MDIKSISFTASGNEASVCTDAGYFDLTRADLFVFVREYLGEDVAERLKLDVSASFFPLYAEDNASEELERLSEKLKAIKYAVYLLGINDKSEKTLRQKLKLKGFSSRSCDDAVTVLKSNEYLSDERFCRRKCELLASGKLFGRRRIISELMAKGLPYALCEQTLDETEIDFEENLRLLYEKLTKGKKADLSNREQKRKLSDKLLRYGYGYDEINSLFDSLELDDEWL